MSPAGAGALRVHATVDARTPPSAVAALARRAEALGCDALHVPEAVHDGLVAAALALAATTRLRVATSVLVAFPRSPMVVAQAAWDLQELSGGRFELGLGTQVRGNVVGRYSTAWSPPVPRMREYVSALRAIFERFQHGRPLRFEGEHYRFTRLQPWFDPGPLPDGGRVPIHLGAIGSGMLALAGERADALVTHPTNTAPRYLREVVAPRLARGAARSGRTDGGAALLVSPLVATGHDAAEVAREREAARRLLAFLYSTPAYRPSLELFGWDERGDRLHALARAGDWDAMVAVVDDAMLDTFVVCAPYAEVGALLRERYAGLAQGVAFPLPAEPARDPEAARAIAALRADA